MTGRVYCSIWICISVAALVVVLTGACIATPAADLGRAKDLITAEDYASAIPLLAPIASADSATGLEALVLLGDCHREQREPREALDCYQRSLQSSLIGGALRRAAKRQLPDCYLGLRDWSGALSVCKELLTEYPDSTPYWHYMMSQCLARQGMDAEASILLDSALSASSAVGDSGMVKIIKAKQAYRAMSRRDWSTALAIYQDLMFQFPEDTADWQYRVGLCYKGMDNIDQAVAVFRNLAASGPQSTAGRQSELRIAECLYLHGKHDEALAALEHYVFDSPRNHSQALLAKAEFYAKTAKDYNAVMGVCDDLIAQYPDTRFAQDAMRLKAVVTLAALKQPNEAKAIYDKLIADNPQSGLLGEWYFYRSLCSYSAGDWAVAREGFRETYSTLPIGKWHAEAKYLEGDCCAHLMDSAAAHAAFREVVDRFADSALSKAAAARLAAAQEGR